MNPLEGWWELLPENLKEKYAAVSPHKNEENKPEEDHDARPKKAENDHLDLGEGIEGRTTI